MVPAHGTSRRGPHSESAAKNGPSDVALAAQELATTEASLHSAGVGIRHTTTTLRKSAPGTGQGDGTILSSDTHDGGRRILIQGPLKDPPSSSIHDSTSAHSSTVVHGQAPNLEGRNTSHDGLLNVGPTTHGPGLGGRALGLATTGPPLSSIHDSTSAYSSTFVHGQGPYLGGLNTSYGGLLNASPTRHGLGLGSLGLGSLGLGSLLHVSAGTHVRGLGGIVWRRPPSSFSLDSNLARSSMVVHERTTHGGEQGARAAQPPIQMDEVPIGLSIARHTSTSTIPSLTGIPPDQHLAESLAAGEHNGNRASTGGQTIGKCFVSASLDLVRSWGHQFRPLFQHRTRSRCSRGSGE
jgi:hypothetical protein